MNAEIDRGATEKLVISKDIPKKLADADNSQAQTPAFECTYRNQQANLPRLCRTNVGTMLFWGKIARQFVCFPAVSMPGFQPEKWP
jgi:hypothetical protein